MESVDQEAGSEAVEEQLEQDDEDIETRESQVPVPAPRRRHRAPLSMEVRRRSGRVRQPPPRLDPNVYEMNQSVLPSITIHFN